MRSVGRDDWWPVTAPVNDAAHGSLRIVQVVGGAELHFYDLVMLAGAGIDVETIDFVRPLPNDQYGFDCRGAMQLQNLMLSRAVPTWCTAIVFLRTCMPASPPNAEQCRHS